MIDDGKFNARRRDDNAEPSDVECVRRTRNDKPQARHADCRNHREGKNTRFAGANSICKRPKERAEEGDNDARNGLNVTPIGLPLDRVANNNRTEIGCEYENIDEDEVRIDGPIIYGPTKHGSTASWLAP